MYKHPVPHCKTITRFPPSRPSTYLGTGVVQLWSLFKGRVSNSHLFPPIASANSLPASHCSFLLGKACASGLPQESDNGPRNSSRGAQEGPDGSLALALVPKPWRFFERRSFTQKLENYYSGKEICLLFRKQKCLVIVEVLQEACAFALVLSGPR